MHGVFSSITDKLLDLAVVPGFSSIGYSVRSRSWDRDVPDLAGNHYLVSGASSGLGTAACRQLAELGGSVHLLVRDLEKGRDTKAKIAEVTGSDHLHVWQCDLASMDSIRAFAERFRGEVPELKALINNAGVMPPERMHSPDGLELGFATNAVGPFLLTAELLEPLRRGGPARVVNVTSGGMYARRLQADDLQLEREDYDPASFYAHTKRCEVILTELWQELWGDDSVSFHSVHPGWADTPGVRDSLPRFRSVMRPILRDADQGADTATWLCWADRPLERPGRFWHDRSTRPTHRLPGTRETEADRQALWSECLRLCDAGDRIGETPERKVAS
ncbi:hypothetical protein BH10ACT11_BH10ACT11_14630 [soil metagenome]